MAIRPPRRLICLAAGTLCLTALVAAPSAGASRADLKVTEGSVSLTAVGDRVKGRFVVRNAGAKPAGVSTAYVTVKQGARFRYLTELRILRLPGRNNDRYEFRTATPSWLGPGGHAVKVCLDVKKKVRESREGNNCRSLGSINVQPGGPFNYEPGEKWRIGTNASGYWGVVPEGYDDSHQTPSALFVWLHGCGGQSEFDIETYEPVPTESYVMIAPTGREGDCWSPPQSGADEAIVTSTIADVSERFNVDPDRIVLGGYSSGGDLSYRYAYHHSMAIEAVLVSNSSPFQDTGLTPAVLPSVSHKFRVVHLAHLSDEAYPIANVRADLQGLIDNEFPVTSVERPGGHYNEPGENGLPGTDADIREVLLPQVDP